MPPTALVRRLGKMFSDPLLTLCNCLTLRCVLPVRARPPASLPKSASHRARILPEGPAGAEPVSEFTPYLLLGDGRCGLCAVGSSSVPRLLENARRRGLGKFLYVHCASSYAPWLLVDVPWYFSTWLTRVLQWSKSTYTYGVAVCLLQIGGEKHAEEVAELMEKVPALRQRIAGKSIPLEVRTSSRPSIRHID